MDLMSLKGKKVIVRKKTKTVGWKVLLTSNLKSFVGVESNAWSIVPLKTFVTEQLKVLMTVPLNTLTTCCLNFLWTGKVNLLVMESKILMIVDMNRWMRVDLNFVEWMILAIL